MEHLSLGHIACTVFLYLVERCCAVCIFYPRGVIFYDLFSEIYIVLLRNVLISTGISGVYKVQNEMCIQQWQSCNVNTSVPPLHYLLPEVLEV